MGMGSELLLEEQELRCDRSGFKGLATPPVTTTATEKWRKRWTLAWGPGERGKCSVFSSTRLDGVTGDQVLTGPILGLWVRGACRGDGEGAAMKWGPGSVGP